MQHMECEIVILFCKKAKKPQRLNKPHLGRHAKLKHDCKQHALTLKLHPIYDLSRPVDQMITRDPFLPHLFCAYMTLH